MTKQDKQALIETALRIKRARNIYGSDITDVKALCEIALASLNAQPVRLPDILSDEFHDYGGYFEYSLYERSLKSSIRAAGYQVQE